MKSGLDLAARLRTLTPGDMTLWSDDDLLVINKPAGLRVVPDGYDPKLPTLVQQLQPEWGRLWVVHRLDKDTSGIIIFARTENAHRALNAQFASRLIKKTYIALVGGVPDWDLLSIDLPLLVDGDRSHRTVADSHNGKPAHTVVKVLRRLATYSQIQANPTTGYTHQIRAHLSNSGFPILGDPLYRYPPDWHGLRVDRSVLPSITRTALHAADISFTHPSNNSPLSFSAPLPADLLILLGG